MSGGSRALALTRRQKKRSQRPGLRPSATVYNPPGQIPASLSPAASDTISPPATPPPPPEVGDAAAPGADSPPAAAKAADSDFRYPTLARMAAIAKQSGTARTFSQPAPAELGAARDLDPGQDSEDGGLAIDPVTLSHESTRANRPASRTALETNGETDPLLREYAISRPQPLPETDLVLPIAVVEAAVAAISAICTAVLLVYGSTIAFWTLGLTLIAGVGSWLAYMLASTHAVDRKNAGAVLLGSQLGMLGWSLALLGPLTSLLLLLPALFLLSLRVTSRAMATAGMVIALTMYLVFEILVLHQVLRAALQTDDAWLAALNSLFATVGVLLFLVAALDLHASRSRAEHLSRARLQELRQVRVSAAQLRQWTEDEAARLQEFLLGTLYGRTDAPSLLEGPLSPLNATIELCGERIAKLQQEREEHRSLEAALRSLTRAMERAWLGLPWNWPDPSDTSVDQLVALLRTPTPRDLSYASTNEDSPLVPIPSLDPSLSPHPWEVPGQHPLAREHLSDSAWSRARDASTSHNGHASPLPWVEWDEWRNWEDQFNY